ncbi:glycosyltransferase family 4 protein [Desulfohalovibrio reitneri]|uniref:glycosyltransferase family 4 protein n=1 Tax=Desulfohalovibrio reitneri TaxID=1307759 RepID=UPI00054E506D|nr:glycosyltransferase family 4 protein [Desulfohalovibrio reitneri]
MHRVVFLTQSGDTLPSVRFRVLPLLEAARDAGVEAERRSIPGSLAKRLPFLLSLPQGATVVLQKKLLNPLDLALLRRGAGRLVYDFDDAVWTCHPNTPAGSRRTRKELAQTARFRAVCRAVDLVVAGNRFLAQKAGPFAKRVEVLPTPLDTSAYTPGLERDEAVTVGWMGTSCNLFFLPEIMPLLRGMGLDRLVVSDAPYTGPGEEGVRFEPWSGEREVDLLRQMDVGLMPLTDDEYTRGKCGFKLLQYMACGVVPVASDVGFNREVIRHGETGFLVRRPEEWREHVQTLAESPDLRHKMARAARRDVVERFDLRPAAERFLDWMKEG